MEKYETSKDQIIPEKSDDLMERYYNVKKGGFAFNDQDAETYARRIDASADLEHHHLPIVEKTAALVPEISNKKVLDVGTGEGRWARYFASKGANVVGIDINPKMIEIAEKRLTTSEPIEFRQGTIDSIEHNDFEFANAFFVTNYIHDLESFFQTLANRLSSDGSFLLTTLSIELDDEQRKIFDDYLLPILDSENHTIQTFPHSVKDYVDSLEKSGFEILSIDASETTNNFANDNLNALKFKINELLILCKKAKGEVSNS